MKLEDNQVHVLVGFATIAVGLGVVGVVLSLIKKLFVKIWKTIFGKKEQSDDDRYDYSFVEEQLKAEDSTSPKTTKKGKGRPHHNHQTKQKEAEGRARDKGSREKTSESTSSSTTKTETSYPTIEGVRKPSPSTGFGLIKGFKTPISAVATHVEADLIFLSSMDRTHRLVKMSTAGTTNEHINLKIEKATITHAAFDPTGRCLAVFLDNESKFKIFAVQFDAKDSFQLIWEIKLHPVGLTKIGLGSGGGFLILCDDKGNTFCVDKMGKEVDRISSSQGHILQWNIGWAGSATLITMCATMSQTCRINAAVSGRSASDPGPLWKGCKVDVFYAPSKAFFPAIVTSCEDDGTYNVDYDDGSQDFCVNRDRIRPKGSQTIGDNFKELRHVMTLSGSRSIVTCCAISQDGTTALTTSKDGTIKLYNIDVRWLQREDPRQMVTFKDTDYLYYTTCAISPNNKIIVVASPDTSLVFYRVDTSPPTIIGEITNSHESGDRIREMFFATKTILVTIAEGDSKVKTWNLAKKGCVPEVALK